MNFVFRKDSGKSPKNSLKVAFCACKWKFGSTTVHCSNSVMHELLWTLSCASNERREAYLSIHVHLIKQIYDYDSKELQWNSVSFILGRTVYIYIYFFFFGGGGGRGYPAPMYKVRASLGKKVIFYT